MKSGHISKAEVQAYERLSPREKFRRARILEQFNGTPSLPLAAVFGDTETIQTLLASGESPNSSGDDGITALMNAARFSHVENVRLLLDAGTDVHRKDNQRGATPLIWAAENGAAEIVRQLLEAGADPLTQTSVGATFLHAAVSGRNLEIIKTVLDKNLDVNAGTTDGYTALHIAAWSRNFGILALLVDRGADVNAKASGGLTALLAVTTDDQSFRPADPACATLLLARGADANVQDAEGKTPLMGAAFYGHRSTVKLLIAHGANVDLKDARGFDAESQAIRARRWKIARFLRNA